VIVFGILKDGRVPMLEVSQQSGYDVYDDYAVNAIKLASPFPPVPASLMATAKVGERRREDRGRLPVRAGGKLAHQYPSLKRL